MYFHDDDLMRPQTDMEPSRRRFRWGRRFARQDHTMPAEPQNRGLSHVLDHDPTHLRDRDQGQRQDQDQGIRPSDQAYEGFGPYQEPAPEDFLPAPPRPRSQLTSPFTSQTSLPALCTYALFAVASWFYWNNELIAQRLAASRVSVIDQGEYWRLFTALAAHADVAHLLANAPLFLIFATLLYAYFGRLLFPTLAFVAGILTNLVTVWFYPPQVQLVGASGMNYAMIAMWLVAYVRFENNLSLGAKSLRVMGFILLILIPSTYEPQVSYLAHGAGFVIGLLLGLAALPYLKPKNLVS